MSSRDSRRIQGPEKTIPYAVFQTAKQKITNAQTLRPDGRSTVDLQKMFLSVDVISQAKGSSFIEVGDTKVVCGVYGPREVQRGTDFKLTGQVSCEVTLAPFSCRARKSPQPDRYQKEISRQIKEALETVVVLEKFPKAQIDVYITVVENGGSLLSSCLMAAGLALCHASIDVYDLVVGADVLWRDGVCLVNPSLREEEQLSALRLKGRGADSGALTLGMMPTFAKGQVALMVQEGELQVEALSEGITLAIDTCHLLHTLARKTLVDHVEKVLETEGATPTLPT